MELNQTVRLGQLLDLYGELLTDKKREILFMYVCENMSYQEIGDLLGISKPAVLDSIKTAEKKLENYENKIKFLEFKQKVNSVLKNSENVKQDINLLLKEF